MRTLTRRTVCSTVPGRVDGHRVSTEKDLSFALRVSGIVGTCRRMRSELSRVIVVDLEESVASRLCLAMERERLGMRNSGDEKHKQRVGIPGDRRHAPRLQFPKKERSRSSGEVTAKNPAETTGGGLAWLRRCGERGFRGHRHLDCSCSPTIECFRVIPKRRSRCQNVVRSCRRRYTDFVLTARARNRVRVDKTHTAQRSAGSSSRLKIHGDKRYLIRSKICSRRLRSAAAQHHI